MNAFVVRLMKKFSAQKMIALLILISQSGDHSNRLFQAIHFEAFALENGMKFVNLAFFDMQKYYPNAKQRWIQIVPYITIKLLRRLKLDKKITQKNIRKTTNSSKNNYIPRILLVGGWDFREHKLTKKYNSYFRKKYEINKEKLEETMLYKKINKWQQGSIVVGIHIRRGDYREWQNGRFNYGDIVYKKAMVRMSRLIKRHYDMETKYIIFSNEEVTIESELINEISRNTWYIDHELMSNCDYLIGPPSTFTMWASYIGKNKYLHLYNQENLFELIDFKTCEG